MPKGQSHQLVPCLEDSLALRHAPLLRQDHRAKGVVQSRLGEGFGGIIVDPPQRYNPNSTPISKCHRDGEKCENYRKYKQQGEELMS